MINGRARGMTRPSTGERGARSEEILCRCSDTRALSVRGLRGSREPKSLGGRCGCVIRVAQNGEDEVGVGVGVLE